ncbi:MAG TPA: primosomal protein N' [Syntrophales bacterium]|nr:primosomal protein N' [Syntrophales bacterium]
MFVTVAVNIPSHKTFSYAVPAALQNDILIGKRVYIPFGKRRLTGYIIERSDSTTCEDIKEIIGILDSERLFNEDDLEFYRWVSQYYIYPLGKALAEILPGGIDPKSDRLITIAKDSQQKIDFQLSAPQRRIIDALKLIPAGLPLAHLKKIIGKEDVSKDIKILQDTGFITVSNMTWKPGIVPKKEKIITLNRRDTADIKLTEKQKKLLDYLNLHGALPVAALREEFKNVLPLIRKLEEKNLVSITEEEVPRRHGQSPDIGGSSLLIAPNEDQKDALHEVVTGLESASFSPYLLHGVTGSGKTEVYLNAIGETLQMNGGVIYLVPEIALTPQLISRFNKRFANQEIAVLHSGISISARYDQWRRIQRGEIKVVIGARSAIFAPVRNLRLIIVDEEHDTSYKQDDRMRYNTRDLAIMKAKLHSATVIVGSATPAIQTYFNTMTGKYKYLVLPKRVEDKPLPEVEIIDMKREAESDSQISSRILSKTLRDAIQDTLESKQQTLLFLNRRGFHTFMFCLDCGNSFTCRNCAVSMTYHASESRLKCHYCDFAVASPVSCFGCNGKRLQCYGVGTEKVEKEIKNIFPQARIVRMDSDTTTRRGAHEKILQAFDRRDIDILVGTQMITKGHDYPYVTLIGVISADTSLNIPDFLSAERTFQLLTQVSGRGGRGTHPGRVIIQTFNPRHYAITRAREHDYMGFYEDELALRSALAYPPFARVVNLHLSHRKRDEGKEGLKQLKQIIGDLVIINKLKGKVEIIGPAESPIAKIKGRYRWQLLLKGKDTHAVHNLAKDILSKTYLTGLDIKVDVDPLNFM